MKTYRSIIGRQNWLMSQMRYYSKKVLKAFVAGICLLVTSQVSAINIDDVAGGVTTTQMMTALTGPGVTISNLTITNVAGCNDNQAVGRFTNGTTGGAGPVLGVPTGVVVGNGQIATGNRLDSSNDVPDVRNGFCTGTVSDPDMVAIEGGTVNGEYASIEFDVVPTFGTLAIPFQFGSDEFPEYVCSDYNDIVGIFVSGDGIAGPFNGTVAPTFLAAENYAKKAVNELSSINWINTGIEGTFGTEVPNCTGLNGSLNNDLFYTDNSNGSTTGGSAAVALTNTNLELDGYTNMLFLPITVTPNTPYHVKIAVADSFDRVFDSAAFIHPLFSTGTFSGFDFGDAPDSYQTLTSNGGANHGIDNTIFMGVVVPDAEITGVPTVLADGDDNIGTNDEDGVSNFPTLLTSAVTYSVNVNVTNNSGGSARLIGWVDFNGNGAFEASEATQATVANGTTGATVALNWAGLSGLVAGDTYVRLRFSTDPMLTTSTPGSTMSDGEVEDYPLTIVVTPSDYGDAPDSYGTLIASTGAQHEIDNTIFIGAAVPDTEADGFPTPNADGDDLNNIDDEEGVGVFPILLTNSASYNVNVNVTNNSGVAANLIGWIDFNGNGTFEAAEGVAVNVPGGTIAASVALSWPDLSGMGMVGGDTYARIRLSRDAALTTTTTGGIMTGGEVEDYALSILTVNFDMYVSTNATCSDTLDTLNVSVGTNVYYCYTVSNTNTTTSFVIGLGNSADAQGNSLPSLEQTYAPTVTQTVVIGPFVAGGALLPTGSTTVSNSQVTATFFGTTDVIDNETVSVTVNTIVPTIGNKQLYFDTVNATPNLTRIQPATNTQVITPTGGGLLLEQGLPFQSTFTMNTGTVSVQLIAQSFGVDQVIRIDLYRGSVSGTLGTLLGTTTVTNPVGAAEVIVDVIDIGGTNVDFLPGEFVQLVLTRTSGFGGIGTLFAPDRAFLQMESGTVVNIDSISVFSAAFPSTTQFSSYKPGSTVYIRATVSDPFGFADITSANLTLTDSAAGVPVNNQPMNPMSGVGAIRVFEYQYIIPPTPAPDGFWDISITANEGSEGTVSHTASAIMIVGDASPILLKTSIVISDPVNASNPKAIPNSVIEYTITATNTGFGYVDLDRTFLTDPVPSQTTLFLGSPANPAQFFDGATTSGLTYTFTSLGSTTDDIAFSNDGGGTFITPLVDGAGFDITVPPINYIEINPKGEFSGSDGVNNPSFSLTFRVRVD